MDFIIVKGSVFMNLKRYSVLCAVLALGLMFCGAAAAVPADTITVGMAADAKSLDPQMTNDTTSSTYMIQMYEPLIEINKDKELVPCLAESWKKLDDLTYEITLRKGVKFHNGAEVTADDAVFTLNRMTTPAAAAVKSYGANIDASGLKVIDRYTFQVKATSPMAGFLSYLTHSSAYILCKAAVEAAGEDYAKHPIGTGPFKFVEKLKGDHVSYERFEDYWGDKARYGKLLMRTIPEATSRVIELETGNIDIAYGIPNNDFKRLQDEGKVAVYNKPGLSITYMGFNTQTPPFDNPKVRKAITIAIDREGALDVVYKGLGRVPTSPLIPVNSYFPAPVPVEYDPDKAEKMLEEAGIKNLEFTIYTNENKQRKDYAEVIQAMLGDLGITVKIQVLEWGTFLEQLKGGKLPVFMIGWAADNINPDPDAYIKAAMHSKFAGPSNRVWLKDDLVDELLDKGTVTPDGPERAEIYRKFCDRVNELNPWCYLAIADTLYGANKNLKGVENFYRGSINRLDRVYYE